MPEPGAPAPDSRAKRIAFVSLLVAALVAFGALGVWQLQRRVSKLDLIARVEARLAAAPRPPPAREDWPKLSAEHDAYRRLCLEGHYLPNRETLVQAVTERGPGFWVLTPLRASDGTIILVNRGFVPTDRAGPEARSAPSADPVAVTGLLRLSEPGGGFLRSNDPVADRWYSRDVAAIAAAQGLADSAPYFVDAEAGPDRARLPIGGLTVVRFRNHHLVYALTWFALALLCAGTLFMVARRRREPAEAERD